MTSAMNPWKEKKHRPGFRALYSAGPVIWVRPGSGDLMGSHTDYNEGYVLVQAIDRDTWLVARPRPDSIIRIASLNFPGQFSFDLTNILPDSPRSWCDYIKGVAFVLQNEGYSLRGFDGLLHSTVPFGSGLSSSAALEVSVAVLFDRLGDLQIEPLMMAKLCQRAENEFVGMRCGILDQYTSCMGEAGHVILLDCRSLSSESSPIAPGIQLVICDTRAERQLTGSEYPERRRQCEQGAHRWSG
jgi:galactokinase